MLEAFKPDDDYLQYVKELSVIAQKYGLPPLSNIKEFEDAVEKLPAEKNAEFTKTESGILNPRTWPLAEVSVTSPPMI